MPTKFSGVIAPHPDSAVKEEPIDLTDESLLPPLEPIKPHRQNAKMYPAPPPPPAPPPAPPPPKACCPPTGELDVKSIFQVIGASFVIGMFAGYTLTVAFSRDLE